MPQRIVSILFLSAAVVTAGCASSGKSASGSGDSVAYKTENVKNREIIATGYAEIRNNNLGRAKDDALEDAKKDAIRKVLGTMVAAQTETKDNVFVDSETIARSEGFIETYEILEAAPDAAGTSFIVKIKAFVSTAKSQAAVDDILRRQGRPRVMVVSADAGAVAETEAIFMADGFSVVNAETSARIARERAASVKAFQSGKIEAAAEVSAESGAELVLLIEVESSNAGKIAGSDLNSCQASVTIRAIEPYTAQVFATDSRSAAYPHIDVMTGTKAAVKKAVTPAARTVRDNLLANWKRGRNNSLEVVISGMGVDEASDLRQRIQDEIRGVKEAELRRSGKGSTAIGVRFEGTSFVFAERLRDLKYQTNTKRLELETVAGNAVYATMKAR